jgi:hypothetical protein
MLLHMIKTASPINRSTHFPFLPKWLPQPVEDLAVVVFHDVIDLDSLDHAHIIWLSTRRGVESCAVQLNQPSV